MMTRKRTPISLGSPGCCAALRRDCEQAKEAHKVTLGRIEAGGIGMHAMEQLGGKKPGNHICRDSLQRQLRPGGESRLEIPEDGRGARGVEEELQRGFQEERKGFGRRAAGAGRKGRGTIFGILTIGTVHMRGGLARHVKGLLQYNLTDVVSRKKKVLFSCQGKGRKEGKTNFSRRVKRGTGGNFNEGCCAKKTKEMYERPIPTVLKKKTILRQEHQRSRLT